MTLSGITAPFGALSRSTGYVTYPLRTLSPLTTLSIAQLDNSFDLHVLATPPAFVLSQDQTLRIYSSNSDFHQRFRRNLGSTLFSIRTESADNPVCNLFKTYCRGRILRNGRTFAAVLA